MNENQLYIQEYNIDTSDLTPSEKKVFEKLIEAARLVAPLYSKQLATLFPKGITKEELELASLKDTAILDPYTVVERKQNGSKLQSIPYHIKFREDLLKIAKILKEAAELSENKDFARRLVMQANALVDGSYAAADIYWLSMKPYKLDIVIGPIDRYDDPFFFKKCSYEAWVGVMNEVMTKEALFFKDLFSASRKIGPTTERIDVWDKIQLRVDKTAIFSGFVSRHVFTCSNLPNDTLLIEKYGSEMMFFEQTINQKFEERHYPIFQLLFHPTFRKSFSKEELRKAAFRMMIIHEMGHPLLRYRYSEERLKELFPIFDEIAPSIVGLKTLGLLLLKDVISQKELEATLVMFICWALDWKEEVLEDPSIEPFVRGNAIALNFFFSSGALKEKGGISWPNFTKMFVALDEIAELAEKTLASGSYNDAKRIVNTYGSLEIFEKFSPVMSKLMARN